MKKIKRLCAKLVIFVCLFMMGVVVEAAEENELGNVELLSRDQILNIKRTDYKEGILLGWEEYQTSKNGEHDGVVPIELINDEIYCSMNLPSESRSDEMIRMKRDNGKTIKGMTEQQSSLLGMGAIYQTTKTTLPKEFTLCIGKIKTFVFSKNAKCWQLIDEQPYPKGVFLYKMPWSEQTTKKCKNIKYFSDHVEIEMTDEEFEGYALHFWGKRTSVEQKDVLYVACAFDFWIKEVGHDGCFTATIGVDAKDKEGSNDSIVQLFYSRGLEVKSEKRTHWGNTIPNKEYNIIWDGYVLKLLYDKWWNVSE